MRLAACSSILVCAACGSPSGTQPDAWTEPVQVGDCDGLVSPVVQQAGIHVPVGTPIEWPSNPPATGMHYPSWAGWNRSYNQLDRGYYVHNAEHGGIVLLYRCVEACPAVVDALTELVRSQPIDPMCQAPIYNRMLVAYDDRLPDGVQVAAVAWGKIYTAGCVDPYLATFAAENYARAPENFCADGIPMSGTFIAR
ncbi:MAG: DUF3105 domain-containing protein [Kofleriaceae bacterium]